MTQKWNELKHELFDKYPLCKFCKIRPATQLHHAIINKAKVRNKKFHKFLDVKENAVEVCDLCHRTADSYDIRKSAWDINVRRYGYKRMVNWYAGLPLRVKDKF